MAAKATRSSGAADPAALVQRLVLSLYEGGVLSPAVLERVIAAGGAIDWNGIADARANDKLSLAGIVVAVMMPGNALDDVERDFAAVIDHLAAAGAAGAAKSAAKKGSAARQAGKRTGKPSDEADEADDATPEEAAEPDDSDDDALLAQLSGTARGGKRASAAAGGAKRSGFNLSNNAVPPSRRNK